MANNLQMWNDLNCNQHTLNNAVFQALLTADAPTNPVDYQYYFDKNKGTIMYYDLTNTEWVPIGGSGFMTFKGTLGVGGTVTALPTDNVKVGDTYKVITNGTYGGTHANKGDLFVALTEGSTAKSLVATWCIVPSGDDEWDGEITIAASTNEYTINHELHSKKVDVKVEDENGNVIIVATKVVDEDNVKITFDDPIPAVGTKFTVIVEA